MNMRITGNTRLIGLLGSPVAHSISPQMHNAAFAKLGLDYTYLCFDTSRTTLADAVNGLRALNARGWNCTMPDKQAMCQLCDQLSPAAEMIGAVNTVVNENGVLTGHNTDGIGFFHGVRDAGVDIKGKAISLIGAGGAATAIAIQAALDGAALLHLFCRQGNSWEHAKTLVDKINSKTDCLAELHDIADYSKLQDAILESILLVNGTSVGMAPKEEVCVLPSSIVLPDTLMVSDVIYNPRLTSLLRKAQAHGCNTLGGLPMLLYQGAEAFRIWTGREMPVEYIRQLYFD